MKWVTEKESQLDPQLVLFEVQLKWVQKQKWVFQKDNYFASLFTLLFLSFFGRKNLRRGSNFLRRLFLSDNSISIRDSYHRRWWWCICKLIIKVNCFCNEKLLPIYGILQKTLFFIKFWLLLFELSLLTKVIKDFRSVRENVSFVLDWFNNRV